MSSLTGGISLPTNWGLCCWKRVFSLLTLYYVPFILSCSHLFWVSGNSWKWQSWRFWCPCRWAEIQQAHPPLFLSVMIIHLSFILKITELPFSYFLLLLQGPHGVKYKNIAKAIRPYTTLTLTVRYTKSDVKMCISPWQFLFQAYTRAQVYGMDDTDTSVPLFWYKLHISLKSQCDCGVCITSDVHWIANIKISLFLLHCRKPLLIKISKSIRQFQII